MIINSIKLKNFRNYQTLAFEPVSDITVFYGKNGQGKTNIIESIFLCSTGKSHRTPKYNEMIRDGNNAFSVEITTTQNDINRTISYNFTNQDGKQILVNDIEIKKSGDLMGCCSTVLFCPEDLAIVRDGPSYRRRFFDIAISQIKPSYFFNLQKYKKLLAQKNTMLRQFYQNKQQFDFTLFDIWNNEIAKIGTEIIVERLTYLDVFTHFAKERHRGITNNQENIDVIYNNDCIFKKKLPELSSKKEMKDEIFAYFLQTLEVNKQRELDQQMAIIGPHRDDYYVELENREIRKFGSQGQKRTAVLAFKLAEADTFYEMVGDYPVLLLDDVLSELDDERKQYLFNNINKTQVFITGTTKEEFDSFNATVSYQKINNGMLVLAQND